MATSSALHISSAKHFLLGIVMGVGFNILVDGLLTIFHVLLTAFFLDVFFNNANTFGLLSLVVRLGLLVGSVVIIHKIFNNKFATIGTAIGFLSTMTWLVMQSAAMLGR
jgi:hypothetical protein